MPDIREIDVFTTNPLKVSFTLSRQKNWCCAPFRILFLLYSADNRSASERAEVLYSELSGEEILQQWLDSHPEVLVHYEEYTRRKKRRRRSEGGGDRGEGVGKKRDGAGSSGYKETNLLQHHKLSSTLNDKLPLYLEPYRGALPPSLMPINIRTTHPHTLLPDNSPGWG